MSNKACTEKKTVVWCDKCKATYEVRHPRDRVVDKCPSCGVPANVESIRQVIAA